MNFDGSKRLEGAGAGMILISPQGDKLKYVLRMTFLNASNNEADMKLIHGMRMAKACGATRLKIYGDSQLVAQKVMSQCDAVNDSMIAYKELYNELEKIFDRCASDAHARARACTASATGTPRAHAAPPAHVTSALALCSNRFATSPAPPDMAIGPREPYLATSPTSATASSRHPLVLVCACHRRRSIASSVPAEVLKRALPIQAAVGSAAASLCFLYLDNVTDPRRAAGEPSTP
ncbi:hypothetical protein QYE76_056749 [Lolium multiflorum]|uniref:RNase H type-1 domain-containing protein n=1 Tax=Lolium multiflorum TaxID=4521 RepID=A0AAD8WQU6_LOLMU|nr:hypothetical protein QYE76_056749 [Lolium multiflorum]